MKSKLSIIFYYRPENKYSYNTLSGVFGSNPKLKDIELYFPANENALLSDLENTIALSERVIIGVSVLTTQFFEYQKLLKTIRNNFGNKITIVAGGPHATADPSGILNLGADIVVVGEGEETFEELLLSIINNLGYNEIKGIAYLDEAKRVIINRKRDFINLDKYPPYNIKYHKFAPIEITRGCPFGCGYCQTPQIFGYQVRHRSLENILSIVEIMKTLNFSDVRFTTPNLFSYGALKIKTVNITLLENLFSNIKKIIPHSRIFIGSFPSEVRPENITYETIELIKKFGANDNLVIGAQSGSQRILDLCKRGHSVEDVYNAAEITIKNGFKANIDVIFGLPGENEEDIMLTIHMMKDLIKMGARIHIHTFMPLPGTPYETSKPGILSILVIRQLNDLIHTGSVYGNWQEQEKIAQKMAIFNQKNPDYYTN